MTLSSKGYSSHLSGKRGRFWRPENGSLFLFCLAIVLLLPAASIEAQRHATRHMIINPLLDDRYHQPDNEVKSFNTFGGWAGFGMFPMSTDDHHLWYQDLGGYIELWRQGNMASMILTGQIQFIADPHNDINFNPRAIFWEEGLLYTSRLDPGYLQIGFMHRCKHDIDNLDSGEERSLIFSSFMVRYQQSKRLLNAGELMFMLGLEQYVITWDRRIPRTMEEHSPNWNDLNNELNLHLHWRSNPHDDGFFADSQFQLIQLDNTFRFNRGISVGKHFHREGGLFRIEFRYEYLHDSGIPASPQDVHLLSIGIRAGSPFVIR